MWALESDTPGFKALPLWPEQRQRKPLGLNFLTCKNWRSGGSDLPKGGGVCTASLPGNPVLEHAMPPDDSFPQAAPSKPSSHEEEKEE